MAQADDHPISIKELDDLVDYLTENLRCTKVVAVDVMNQHYHGQLDGRLVVEKQDLICDDEPHGGWVTTNPQFWDLKLDGDGHAQVIPRIELWRKARGRIAEECDPRAIWPPHLPAFQIAAPPPAPPPQATAGAEMRAIAHLKPLLKLHRDAMSKDEAWKECKPFNISYNGFENHVWPTARELAGLERKAPAGRKRRKPKDIKPIIDQIVGPEPGKKSRRLIAEPL